MQRVLILVLFLLLALPTTPVSADHGMVTWECGTHVINSVDEYTKGRTDSLVHHVDMTVGCHHLIYDGVTAAGLGEAQGNPEQLARCWRDGAVSAADAFFYAGHLEVDPKDVTVSCRRYSGPD